MEVRFLFHALKFSFFFSHVIHSFNAFIHRHRAEHVDLVEIKYQLACCKYIHFQNKHILFIIARLDIGDRNLHVWKVYFA